MAQTETRLTPYEAVEDLLDQRKESYLELAEIAQKRSDRPGMKNAVGTLTTLAEGVSITLPSTEDRSLPTGIAPHQRHVVNAATAYVRLTERLNNGANPPSLHTLYSTRVTEVSPAGANRMSEAVALFSDGEFRGDNNPEGIKVSTAPSVIPNYDVRMIHSGNLRILQAVKK